MKMKMTFEEKLRVGVLTRKFYRRGEITLVQASWAIYKAGLRHSPPDEFQTLKMLGIY